jgi:hypothetical protein
VTNDLHIPATGTTRIRPHPSGAIPLPSHPTFPKDTR